MAMDGRVMKLAGMSDLLRLTGAMFRYPTPAFVEALADGTFAKECRAAADAVDPSGVLSASFEGALPPSKGALDAADALREVRHEHTRLFGVPRQEIVYLYESRFMQEEDGAAGDYLMFVNPCCMDVEKIMKQSGYAPARSGEEPLDHVSTELEYLGLLVGKMATAAAEGDGDSFAVRQVQVSNFLEQHANRWMDRFFESVEREAQSDVYRSFAAMAQLVWKCFGADADIRQDA